MRELIEQMKAAGLVQSDRDFSTRWLRRAPNHIADRGAALSTSTAVRLYLRLRMDGHDELASRVWRQIVQTEAKHASR